MASPETQQQRADRLAPVAKQWVLRLREEDVDSLAAALLDPLPRRDLYALIGLLGGAADPSVDPEVWWGWVRYADAINAAAPIVWDEDERPIEDLDSEQINGLIERLDGQRLNHREIGERTGLSAMAVERRLRRLRERSRAAAGVA